MQLEKIECQVVLTVTSFPLQLDELIYDCDLIETEGHVMLETIINATSQLTESKLVVRNIDPTKVFFQDDLYKMMFCDIDQVTQEGANDMNERRCKDPFNSSSYGVFTGLK